LTIFYVNKKRAAFHGPQKYIRLSQNHNLKDVLIKSSSLLEWPIISSNSPGSLSGVQSLMFLLPHAWAWA